MSEKYQQVGHPNFLVGCPYTGVVMVSLAFDPDKHDGGVDEDGNKVTKVPMREMGQAIEEALAGVFKRFGVNWTSPVGVFLGNGPPDGNWIGQFNPELPEEERVKRGKRIEQIVDDVRYARDPAERVLAGLNNPGKGFGQYA